MQLTITPEWIFRIFVLICLLLTLLIIAAKPLIRYIIKTITNDAVSKLLSDKYTQNLAEFLPSLKRFSVLNAIEMSLRAEQGNAITRPLGTPKHFLSFENLMFQPRIMSALSLPATAPIDMSVTIGPNAEKPLIIEIPLMISAMAYGLAMSEESKIALAKAANQLQTATCSGEGPALPEEREIAEKYVLQISRWSWGGRTNEEIASAAMLEVQMGQGADIGAVVFPAEDIAGKARKIGGLAPDESPSAYPAPPGIQSPEDWPEFMKNLRQRANGIPIALKLMATDHIEEDLAAAIRLGFDAVVIDGAQGGAHATSPMKQDDFGIPTLYALVRAKRYLKNYPMSLIIAGGFFTPGQCLKALALGADAIYLATIPLFALAHNQLGKVTPWEPITTLVFYDSPSKTKLNIQQAASSVVNELTAMTLEMEEAMRALGKSALNELSPDDLVALDAATAEVTGVRGAYNHSTPPISGNVSQPENLRLLANELEQCRQTLYQLNSCLRYARCLAKFTETAIEKVRYCHDLSEVSQLSNESNSFVRLKLKLDGSSDTPT